MPSKVIVNLCVSQASDREWVCLLCTWQGGRGGPLSPLAVAFQRLLYSMLSVCPPLLLSSSLEKASLVCVGLSLTRLETSHPGECQQPQH